MYRPGEVLTGSVWDAIGASVLALAPARRRRVLMLGLGGGSAARVVRALAPRAHIVAVEIDPRVVALARQWFELDDLDIEVVEADARDYLARARGRFDAVIEDVFIGTGRDAVKPEGLPLPGLARAARRVRPGGILVSNTLDEWRQVSRVLADLYPRQACITTAGYDNRVYVAGSGPGVSGSRLRAAARATELAPSLDVLSFRAVKPRR